ncbi:MAG: zinc ribbon domain-containing protein [Chloroflexi bacterium]|nr:zinc ribbon domain-containing protein [Chloroflexota bacterium]
MRSTVRLLLLLALLVIPLQASAQSAVPLGRVEVALWPEYDQRAVLVIYRVTLPAATTLPATVVLPVPARVGDPTAVAEQASDGALILASYERAAVDGDWASLTIQADSAVLQVEYYDPLTIDGFARSYDFVWPAGYAVTELAYEILQPVGASGMQIDPASTSDRVGSNGLTFYSGSLGAQDGSAEARIQVGYSKSDEALSVESAPLPGSDSPAIGAAQPAGVPASLTSLAPWLIGGLGLALLVAGALLFLRSRQADRRAGRPRHRPTRSTEGGERTIDASAVFCHSCGTPAGVADAFCRKCGTRLRT